jgi:hypothetical protein
MSRRDREHNQPDIFAASASSDRELGKACYAARLFQRSSGSALVLVLTNGSENFGEPNSAVSRPKSEFAKERPRHSHSYFGVLAMPIRGEVPNALAPVEKIRRSVDIWDKIQPMGKHKALLPICVLAAIGFASLLGLVFGTAMSNRSAALFVPTSVDTPAKAQIDPLQIMMNSKDLSVFHTDDYSLVSIDPSRC